MAAPTKVNFKIYQGSTFKEVFRWESSTKAYAPITGITKAAPMVVTSIAHGIPVGWRGKITNVAGMKEVNSTETYHIVTGTATNTLTVNSINSLGFTDYTSGGVFEYNVPSGLSSATARMQIRATLSSTEIIDELTTVNGKIVIDDSNKTISVILTDIVTAAYTFSNAVYSMEIITGGEVVPFIYGSVSLINEITR